MTEYDNELTGALFSNDKGDNENRPDVTGTCQIQGEAYRIVGWRRLTNNTGKPYFKLKFESEAERDERLKALSEEGDGLAL